MARSAARLVLFFSGFLLCSWTSPEARADVSNVSDFKLLATGDYTTPVLANSSTANATFNSKIGYGGGMIYGHQLRGGIYSRGLFIEGGVFYSRRSWDDSVNGKVSTGVIEVPIYLNLRIFRFISLNAGGYYSFNNIGAQTSYIIGHDYGLLLGGEIVIPFSQKREFIFGVNYESGLANVSNVGGNLELKDVQVFIGMRFGRMGQDTFFASW